MISMTLDEVIAYQADHDMKDTHLVFFGVSGFHLAHTDEERGSGMDLHDCELHRWLADIGGPEDVDAGVGLYKVTPRSHDPVSENFRSDASPYEFEPVT